jgi:hypothetical protein
VTPYVVDNKQAERSTYTVKWRRQPCSKHVEISW